MTDFVFAPTGENAERVVVIGRAGSGKTTLAKMLAGQAPRCVWMDVKGLNDPGWPVHGATEFLDLPAGARAPHLAELLTATPRITVQLASRPGVDDEAQLDAIAEACYVHGNVLFVLDDAMGVVTSKPPYYLNRIATMGRARGVGFMGIMQRAHRIPLVLLSEANLVFAFSLHGEADVTRLVTECGPELAAARDLQGHGFLVYSHDLRTAQVCEPLTVPAGGG